MTNRAPVCSVSVSTATLSGSVPSVAPPPRLMLMMSAPLSWAAHSIPASTCDSEPLPRLSSTLPISSSAPGATPLRRPFEPAPVPATVAATWVPWPCSSLAEGSAVKFLVWVILPATSGWVSSMPVSRTATLTPLPS